MCPNRGMREAGHMRRLLISLIACAAMLAPLGARSSANEAHHQGKSTSAKKSMGAKTKTKQTKQPPVKAKKSTLRLAPVAAKV
jgi:hypothetical protein